MQLPQLQMKYRSIRGLTVLWVVPILLCVGCYWVVGVIEERLDYLKVPGLHGLDENDPLNSWVINSLDPWLFATGHGGDWQVLAGQLRFLAGALIVLCLWGAWRSTLDPVARRSAKRRRLFWGDRRLSRGLIVAGVVCVLLMLYMFRLRDETLYYERMYTLGDGLGLDIYALHLLYMLHLVSDYFIDEPPQLNNLGVLFGVLAVALLVGAWLFRNRKGQQQAKQAEGAAQPLHALEAIRPPTFTDRRGLIVGLILLCAMLFIFGLLASFVANTANFAAFLILGSAPLWMSFFVLVLTIILMITRPNPHKLITRRQTFVQEEERERAQRAGAQLANPATVPNYLEATIPGTEQAQEPERCAVIGAPTVGDLAWCASYRRGPDWLTLPLGELSKHGAIIGASGTGKTVTLMRLAYLWRQVYQGRVYYLDAKGDRNTAAAFLALMESAGVQARMFPAGSMDGWRGDATALLNRLMAVENYSEAYYRAIAKRLLTLALNSSEGVPRNSDDLIKLLSLDRLAEVYAGHDEEEEVEEIQRRDAAGTRNRYRSFFGALNGKLDRGWSWEDTQAGYILLDGLALKDEAASLGRYLLEDFAHYVVARKNPEEKALLIVDEYSALSTGGTDAANLFERLRSYGATIVISSQSYAGLGKPEDAERILDAANWLLLHRSANPERLAARAGKERRLQEAYHFGGSMPSDPNSAAAHGSLRLEEEELIHPDAIRRLGVGEAVLIAHGRYVKARMAVSPVKPDAYSRALAWVNGGRSAPAPQPATAAQAIITPQSNGANGSTPAPGLARIATGSLAPTITQEPTTASNGSQPQPQQSPVQPPAQQGPRQMPPPDRL